MGREIQARSRRVQPEIRALVPPDLAGRYSPRGSLGEGGMGRVVAAYDRELARLVALKFMQPAAGHALRVRFEREAMALAGLSHPNIVRLFDFGTCSLGTYLVLEHLEGCSMDSAPPDVDPVRVMLDVARGLTAVHEAGLTHRDVKPANILLTTEGRAVLLDFGLIRDPRRTSITRTGTVGGTVSYLSPEALEGLAVGPASDWYSWGVTLFELLEGRRPYTLLAMLEGIQRGVRPPLEFERLAPGSPEAALIRRCTLENPSERPRSAAEVEEILRASRVGRGAGRRARRGSRRPHGAGDARAEPCGPIPRSPAVPRVGRAALLGIAGVLALGIAAGDAPVPGVVAPSIQARASSLRVRWKTTGNCVATVQIEGPEIGRRESELPARPGAQFDAVITGLTPSRDYRLRFALRPDRAAPPRYTAWRAARTEAPLRVGAPVLAGVAGVGVVVEVRTPRPAIATLAWEGPGHPRVLPAPGPAARTVHRWLLWPLEPRARYRIAAAAREPGDAADSREGPEREFTAGEAPPRSIQEDPRVPAPEVRRELARGHPDDEAFRQALDTAAAWIRAGSRDELRAFRRHEAAGRFPPGAYRHGALPFCRALRALHSCLGARELHAVLGALDRAGVGAARGLHEGPARGPEGFPQIPLDPARALGVSAPPVRLPARDPGAASSPAVLDFEATPVEGVGVLATWRTARPMRGFLEYDAVDPAGYRRVAGGDLPAVAFGLTLDRPGTLHRALLWGLPPGVEIRVWPAILDPATTVGHRDGSPIRPGPVRRLRTAEVSPGPAAADDPRVLRVDLEDGRTAATFGRTPGALPARRILVELVRSRLGRGRVRGRLPAVEAWMRAGGGADAARFWAELNQSYFPPHAYRHGALALARALGVLDPVVGGRWLDEVIRALARSGFALEDPGALPEVEVRWRPGGTLEG